MTQNKLTVDLSVSIISTDNSELLLQCLLSIIENTEKISLELIVVDNASEVGVANSVRRDFPQVNILSNSERLGFSTNNNLVLSRATGRYLMLLNDDTLVTDGALDQLVSFLDDHQEAAAVGANLLNPDGSLQPSYGTFPNPFLEGIWPVINWAHYFSRSKTSPFPVDFVHGAAMLVRRNVLSAVGVLDTKFDPIYSEEIDWCYRIKEQGGQIFHHPDAKIIHYGSQTMDRVVPQKYLLLLSHKHLFFKKHYGDRSASIYKMTLFLATLIKYLWWKSVGVTVKDHDRRRAKASLQLYLLKRIKSFDRNRYE